GASNVHVKLLSEESDEPSKLAGLKYQLLTENKRNEPKGKVLKIDYGNKESDKFNGHFRLYKTADFVLEVQPFEQSFNNVLDFMAGKVPGVDINGDEVKI